jgi:rhodanese-related sulfurtransferase
MQERDIILSPNYKLDAADAKRQIDAYPEIVILDVGSDTQFHEQHIPGAINLPFAEIEASEIASLPSKDATIYVYSRAEYTSEMVVYTLLEWGYTAVYSLGSLAYWPYEKVSG